MTFICFIIVVFHHYVKDLLINNCFIILEKYNQICQTTDKHNLKNKKLLPTPEGYVPESSILTQDVGPMSIRHGSHTGVPHLV